MTEWPLIRIRARVLPHSLHATPFSRSFLDLLSTMDPKPQQQKRHENTLSLLNAAIDAMNLAKEVSSGTPAKAALGTVSVILTMIRVRFLLPQVVYSSFSSYQDSMANKSDYVELGLACANVCKALHRGLGEKTLDDLSPSVRDAIEQLTT